MGKYVGMTIIKLLLYLIFYLLDIILSLLTFLYGILLYAPYIYITTSDTVSPPSKSIVIIGYQFAGFEIHKYFQNNPSIASQYKFTIIEAKTYFEFIPSILSVLPNPSSYKSISFPLNQCFDSYNSQLIRGKAISIDSVSNFVSYYLIGSETEIYTIQYDYLYICTGSKYASPVKISIDSSYINYTERESQLISVYNKLKQDGDIGIIGGGPVGVEILSEILEYFPNKNITILDALPKLCRLFPESTINYIQNWIKKQKNVTLRLNAKINAINELNDGKYELKVQNKDDCDDNKDAEEVLKFDLIFKCWGFRPNSSILNKGFDSKCLTDKFKFIVVDEYMRLVNNSNQNIFALGDVIDQARINEVKLAHTAELHANYLYELLLNELNDKSKAFKPYHKWLLGDKITSDDDDKMKWDMPLVFTISLGSMDGSMGFGSYLLNGWISQIFKWFIQISLCQLIRRKGIFDITINNNKIWRMYPCGYRIFNLLWKFNHSITKSYIRSFNKQKQKQKQNDAIKKEM